MSANQENSLLLKTGAIVAVPPPGTVALFSDASGNIYKIDSTGTVSAVGGGGGGFTSNVILQGANSLGAQVNTLQLLNQFLVNTAGSETADWDVTVPVGGVQTALRVGRANLAGPAAVTTASATPTVAFPPRASALQITLGQLATKLTVTGLDLSKDLGYDITYYITSANPPAAQINLTLNDTDATGVVRGYSAGASLAVDSNTVLYVAFTRAGPQHGLMKLRDTGPGNAKAYWLDAYDNTVQEHLMGRSNLTANVTSFSMAGLPINSVWTISKILPSIA